MANFLFWNTNRRDVTGIVAEACRERESDVLILAEYELSPVRLLQELDHSGVGATYLATLTFSSLPPVARPGALGQASQVPPP
jgi:hypothetical protein